MSGRAAAIAKMRDAGVADAAIEVFAHYYDEVVAGSSGSLPESSIEPVASLPTLDSLADADPSDHLDRAVVVKLNGGLGTSMGMPFAKSLLPVKEGRTFLDVIVGQVRALRAAHDVRLPLVLMNSFSTDDDTRAALAGKGAESDVPVSFLQNREPKLLADSLEPVSWPADPSLEWCPPGHGDLYTALAAGPLDTLLAAGYRWAFVSNSDNLGAVFEPRILAHVASREIPFLMEVAVRTAADKKGGHIARREGRFVLRETAQTPDEDVDAFQDVTRHRYFNTNSLWIDLEALAEKLRSTAVLGLPLIVNRKTVDPADKSSPAVLQLETAMGAAIGVFEDAAALCVPRTRFAPVKTTSDLLLLRSDLYELTPDCRVAPRRDELPLVSLDDGYFKLIDDFDARFPAGAPSLLECTRLSVRGDVRFGAGVVCRGELSLDGPATIPDGTVLGN